MTVDFAEKDIVKELGAKWNGHEKFWFIPAGHSNPDAFAKWVVNSEKKLSTKPPAPCFEGTRLAVDYAEKDIVKALGAKWNVEEKFWYIPAGHCNPDAFAKWFVSDKKVSSGQKRQRGDFHGNGGGNVEMAMEYGRRSTIQQMRKSNCPHGYCLDYWKYVEHRC